MTKGEKEIFAELSGNLLYCAGSASDFPTTGDWVYADFYDDTHAIIYGVFPGKTLTNTKRYSLRVRKNQNNSVKLTISASSIEV